MKAGDKKGRRENETKGSNEGGTQIVVKSRGKGEKARAKN